MVCDDFAAPREKARGCDNELHDRHAIAAETPRSAGV
jgi:hypothetical protein